MIATQNEGISNTSGMRLRIGVDGRGNPGSPLAGSPVAVTDQFADHVECTPEAIHPIWRRMTADHRRYRTTSDATEHRSAEEEGEDQISPNLPPGVEGGTGAVVHGRASRMFPSVATPTAVTSSRTTQRHSEREPARWERSKTEREHEEH